VFDFAIDVGIFDGEVEGLLIDGFGIDGPGLGGIGGGFLKLDEFFQVVVVEGIGLAEIAAGIELVIPDFAGGRALFEEEDDGFDACTLEDSAGIVEDAVEVAVFKQQLSQANRSVVRIGQKSVFDDDAAASARLENLDEVLEEEESGFAGFDVEVLLNFLALAAAEPKGGLARTTSKRSFS